MIVFKNGIAIGSHYLTSGPKPWPASLVRAAARSASGLGGRGTTTALAGWLASTTSVVVICKPGRGVTHARFQNRDDIENWGLRRIQSTDSHMTDDA